jgi:hypothetical protein
MFESILCQVTEYDPDVHESLIGLAVFARAAISMPWRHKWTCRWDSVAGTLPPRT